MDVDKNKHNKRYNPLNNEYSQNASNLMNRGFMKISLDYNLDSANFDINNYPYCFKKTSDKYQELQIALYEMKIGQTDVLSKAKSLISVTNVLIDVISREFRANYE